MIHDIKVRLYTTHPYSEIYSFIFSFLYSSRFYKSLVFPSPVPSHFTVRVNDSLLSPGFTRYVIKIPCCKQTIKWTEDYRVDRSI